MTATRRRVACVNSARVSPRHQRPPTYLEYAIANRRLAGDGQLAAANTAARAVHLAWQVAMVGHEQGFPVSQADLAESEWGGSLRTVERDWRRFAQAFPGEDGPNRVAELLAREYGRRLASQHVGSLASADLATA